MATAQILLNNVTTTGAGEKVATKVNKTLQATLSGAGAAASIDFEGSNDGLGWVLLGNVGLTSAAPSDGFAHDAPWVYVRANLKTISGSGAAVIATIAF